MVISGIYHFIDFRRNGLMRIFTTLISLIGLHILAQAQTLDYPIRPVPFTQVKVNDAFWQPRLETNRKVTIPFAFGQCEQTGRINNFAVAARIKTGKFSGAYPFDDSDLYKVMEGAAYSLMVEPDIKLEQYLDSLIVLIAGAQEDDGYLMTWRTINPNAPPTNWSGAVERWSNLDGGHELYCAGHMYEAAAAHYLATGKRSFLNVALKNADLICSEFSPSGRNGYPGHQEIELGLVKLYRITGEVKYLKQAELFLDRRGRRQKVDKGDLWETRAYWQDHKPVIQQTEAVGHAVRAGYMYSAMADISALIGRQDYKAALDSIWHDVVSRKYYITGGVGSSSAGENFGQAYDLPNEEAYCETCASIAMIFWNYRMFLLTGEVRYYDVLERTLYNAFLSGISLKGNRFFYPNRLASKGDERSQWFSCACCPSNVCRFIPSLPGYIYASDDKGIYVNLFVGSEANVSLGKNEIKILQKTGYPWDGRVSLKLANVSGKKFSLYFRLPAWTGKSPLPGELYTYLDSSAEKISLRINGKSASYQIQKGYAVIDRKWSDQDSIEFLLPMQVRQIIASDAVAEDCNLVALSSGTLVYCLEGVDNGASVDNILIPDNTQFQQSFNTAELNGIQIISAEVPIVLIKNDGLSVATKQGTVQAIPYYAWAHRGLSPMRIWMPRKIANLEILPE